MKQQDKITSLQGLLNFIKDRGNFCVFDKGEEGFIIEAPNNADVFVRTEKDDNINDIILRTIVIITNIDRLLQQIRKIKYGDRTVADMISRYRVEYKMEIAALLFLLTAKRSWCTANRLAEKNIFPNSATVPSPKEYLKNENLRTDGKKVSDINIEEYRFFEKITEKTETGTSHSYPAVKRPFTENSPFIPRNLNRQY